MNLLLQLKNGGKEELTMDEARELYDELHQIFGKPVLTLPDLGIPKTDQNKAWPYNKPPSLFGRIGEGPMRPTITSFTGDGKVRECYGPIKGKSEWPS